MVAKVDHLKGKKLELKYPTSWSYKLIVKSHDELLLALEQILGRREYKLNRSNSSKSGKFSSFNLELLVHSDEDRVALFEQLRGEKSIKYLL